MIKLSKFPVTGWEQNWSWCVGEGVMGLGGGITRYSSLPAKINPIG